LNEGKGDSSTSLGVNKVDVNQLLQQVGVVEGLAEKKAEVPVEKKSE